MERARASLKAYKANSATIDSVFRAICLDITENVGSTRASVWTFHEPLRDAIESVCLYDTRDASFTSGAVLREEDFPAYFHAVTNDLRIVAPDAITHEATSAFDDVYFAPLDIRSLLDYVVLVGDRPVAVLCCEHCGEQKTWAPAHIDYLQAMSSVVAFTLKHAEKAAA